jgi:hypothetical protein
MMKSNKEFVNLSLAKVKMKSVNVQISDREFKQLGLKKESFSFSELMDIITKKINRDNLKECLELSEKHGLSKMTLAEINAEIQGNRNAASDS